MNKAAKVLSFSPYASWQLHALYEIAICHNLQWRGHSYHYVTCDGLLSDCDINWEATVGPRPANACATCQAQVKGLLERFQIPNTPVGKFKTASDVGAARKFVDELQDHKLLDAVYHGYPVGSWVKSSIHSHLRINVIDCNNPQHSRAVRSYLYSGALALACIGRMLDDLRPTVLLLFNGRMSVTRIALELAKERGIRVICHERGLKKETLLLWENEGCLALSPYARLWKEWGEIPLNPREVQAVQGWVLDRARGANLNWSAFSVQSSLGKLESFLEQNRGKQVWGLFTSSTDEFVSSDEFTSVFGTQGRWIEETIEFARNNSSLVLVIRVHPNSGGKASHGSNRDELAYFEGLASALPPNVALVMPDDAVSTYALIDRCDLGLAYCSTVSLELACRGKRVISAARSFFTPCPSVRLITARENYAAILSDYAATASTPAEAQSIATAAFRFAYAYIFRWDIPFPLVHMPEVTNGQLAARTLDDLRPGKERCLDYCSEIVLGLRPAVPVPDASSSREDHPAEAEAICLALDVVNGRTAETRPVRISVVIACYDGGELLRRCVESIARQTATDFEVILVQERGNADMRAAAQACLNEFPDLRIQMVEHPGSSQPGPLWNVGVARAKGEFVLPLDAHDQIDSHFLEYGGRRIAADDETDVVYADVLFCEGSTRSRKTPGQFETGALKTAEQLMYCGLLRKELWVKIGGYPDRKAEEAEWDFWLAASLVRARGAYIPCIGLIYHATGSRVYSRSALRDPANALIPSPGYPSVAYAANAASAKRRTIVSVVIACEPHSGHLLEAVESVVAQHDRDWELILVADANSDAHRRAKEIVARFPAEPLRLVEKPSGNLAEALNAGIKVAQGRYICRLNADDRLHRDFLLKTAAVLERHPEVGIAYPDEQYFGGETRIERAAEYDFRSLCTNFRQLPCASLVRKEEWLATTGYKQNMVRGGEEWDYWIGCGEHRYFGRRIPEILAYRRWRNGPEVKPPAEAQLIFAQIVMNHPKLYDGATQVVARAILDAAKPKTPATVAPRRPAGEILPAGTRAS